MRFICKKTELSDAITNISRVVPQKSTIPALEGILIKAYGEKINVSGYSSFFQSKKKDACKWA